MLTSRPFSDSNIPMIGESGGRQISIVESDILQQFVEEVTVGAVTTTYVADAPCGVLTSEAQWRIYSVVYNSGTNITTIKWADGNGSFDNICDDRATIEYN